MVVVVANARGGGRQSNQREPEAARLVVGKNSLWRRPNQHFCFRGSAGIEEEEKTTLLEFTSGKSPRSLRRGGVALGRKTPKHHHPECRSSSHQDMYPLRSTPVTSDETVREKLPLEEERKVSLIRASHVAAVRVMVKETRGLRRHEGIEGRSSGGPKTVGA